MFPRFDWERLSHRAWDVTVRENKSMTKDEITACLVRADWFEEQGDVAHAAAWQAITKKGEPRKVHHNTAVEEDVFHNPQHKSMTSPDGKQVLWSYLVNDYNINDDGEYIPIEMTKINVSLSNDSANSVWLTSHEFVVDYWWGDNDTIVVELDALDYEDTRFLVYSAGDNWEDAIIVSQKEYRDVVANCADYRL